MNEQHLHKDAKNKKKECDQSTTDLSLLMILFLFLGGGLLPFLLYIRIALWHNAGWSQNKLWSITAPQLQQGSQPFCYEGYIKHMYHFKCLESPFCSLSPLKHTFQVFLNQVWTVGGPPEMVINQQASKTLTKQLQTNTLVIEWKKMEKDAMPQEITQSSDSSLCYRTRWCSERAWVGQNRSTCQYLVYLRVGGTTG